MSEHAAGPVCARQPTFKLVVAEVEGGGLLHSKAHWVSWQRSLHSTAQLPSACPNWQQVRVQPCPCLEVVVAEE